jgi:SAM-dependent methyltransferase
MTSASDPSALNAQQEHWESRLSAKPDMFGLEPSESALAAETIFAEQAVSALLELGAGQGRDTLFFAENGLDITALDYTDSSFTTICDKAEASDGSVFCVRHDVRKPLPFPDASFDACYSHMLFCMALTTNELEELVAQVRRVVRPGGLVTYTARTTKDAHFEAGIDRGDDMYEHGGFIVHFFSPELIEHLADGFDIVDQFEFEEAWLPRRLVSVTMRKRDI